MAFPKEKYEQIDDVQLEDICGKILVVDDEELVRKTISRFLEKFGYTTDTAYDGQNALIKLGKEKYDLVITDLKMPNMDGRELLKFMEKEYPAVPRIVLTAVGSNEDILLALKTGAYDFISKPIEDLTLLKHSVYRALEKKYLSDERRKMFQQLEKTNDVISMLNKGHDTEEIFKMMQVSFKSILPFNLITLIAFEHNTESAEIRLFESDRPIPISEGNIINLKNLVYKKFIDTNDIKIVSNVLDYFEDVGVPNFVKKVYNKGLKSAVSMPVIIDNKMWGKLIFVSEIEHAYTVEHVYFLKAIAGQVALSIQRGELLTELEVHSKHLEHLVKVRTHEVLKTQKTTIFALSKLAEMRDSETGEHLERMRNYCVMLAQLLKYQGGFDEVTNEFLRDIYDSSILHDIGKVGIPDMILLKPGPLSAEEFEIMKTHTTIGYKSLKESSRNLGENSFLDMVKDVILYHHERWDGKGYPMGLKGREIPLAARIVAFGDIYDALTSKRPYKDAISHKEALEMMKKEETRFDPIIFKMFIDNNGDFDRIRRQFE